MGMKYKLGIVGKDIAYSLSPYIHLSFGKEADIQLTYDIFDLDTSPLEFIEKFFEEGGTGLNITKPFKEIVAERYSSLGDVSVNTLSLETKADLNNNTVIKGTSTDGAGLLEDLISRDINVKNKNVLLLGLGGAGYAIANFLSHICSLHVWNRSKNKYKLLDPSQNLNIFEENKTSYDLVISCVSSLDEAYLELISDIKFNQYTVKIEKSETDKRIKEIAKNQPNFKEASSDTKAEKGDLVVLDYSATVNDKLTDIIIRSFEFHHKFRLSLANIYKLKFLNFKIFELFLFFIEDLSSKLTKLISKAK